MLVSVNIIDMKFITHGEEENIKIVEAFLSKLSPKSEAVVVGLYGDLGAGKTTFTKAVAKVLGVPDTITSPTFVIEKIYELVDQKFLHLIHIDAYRLDKEEELLNLGWKNIISDPKNIILIEWPEKVSGIIPEHIKINFKHGENESEREVEIEE
ncbi:MAG TPA: tRNA (adenosine(37)-N6)-threonylcarbamoyltransferase complex ATPase subunit type 1 TsaE [Candidatus Paceibacterota bacterium]